MKKLELNLQHVVIADKKTLVAWDYDERLYKKIHFIVGDIFKKNNIAHAELRAPWPHISAAMVSPSLSREERDKFKMAGGLIKPKFIFKKFDILIGQETPFDYFSVEFHNPPEFDKFLKFAQDVCGEDRVVKYKENRPHLSLWALKKGDHADVERLLPEIQKEARKYLQPFTPTKMSIWDNFEISEIETIGGVTVLAEQTWLGRVRSKYSMVTSSSYVEVPSGSILFHGTVEPFETSLKAGGDGLLWFSDTPKIAQLYIPQSGGRIFVASDDLVKPSKNITVQMIQKEIGIDYDMSKVTWRGNQIDSFPSPKGWKTFPTKEYVEEQIVKKGFGSKEDKGSYKIKTHQNKILTKDESAEGRLFVAKVKEPLKIWRKAKGDSDLTDLQYHDMSGFKNAKQSGFDGVLIDDFAQSEDYGNFGHLSVGLFDTKKLEIRSLPAQYREWDYKAKGTPEYPNPPASFLNGLV